jgi:hypothetical protein
MLKKVFDKPACLGFSGPNIFQKTCQKFDGGGDLNGTEKRWVNLERQSVSDWEQSRNVRVADSPGAISRARSASYDPHRQLIEDVRVG